MLKNYIITAFRTMYRHKRYTFINILGLATGIACAILIFLWIQDELSFDRFHDQSDRIYRIVSKFHGSQSINVPGPLAPFLKSEVPEIENATRLHGADAVFQYKENIFRLKGLWAEPELLEIFTFPALRGDAKAALEHPGLIVITEETAQKLFGDEDPIDKTITIDNQHSARVAAVLKNVPDKSSAPLQFDFLQPFQILYSWREPDSWTASSDYNNFILGTANSTPRIIEQKIQQLFDKYNIDPEWKLALQSITDVHLYSNFDLDLAKEYGDIRYVILFSFIAFLILLVACINYVNLSTAHSLLRTREIGLRKVIGARQSQIFQQFLGESLLFTVSGASIAILMVELILPVFNQVTHKHLTIDYSDWSTLGKFWGLILITGFLSGIYPAV